MAVRSSVLRIQLRNTPPSSGVQMMCTNFASVVPLTTTPMERAMANIVMSE